MALVESKARAVKQPQNQKKTCPVCNQLKPLKDFYPNRDWLQQHGKDLWCKDCAIHQRNKDGVRRYYWENNKEWSQPNWTKAVMKAQSALMVTPLYNDASQTRQKVMLQQAAAQSMKQFYTQNYSYQPHDITYQQAKALGKILDDDPDKKNWDDEFQGYFTNRQLRFLRDYYKKLLNDFAFQDASTQDFAKKMCRASLTYNKAQDDYAAGKCDLSTVKDAMSIFDTMAKSANFAACRRKPQEQVGMNSWAQTTLYLQTHGYLKKNQNQFDEDTIDRVIMNYRHLPVALGLDENM